MKSKRIFIAMAALAILAGTSVSADAQYNYGGNPGIAMAGSADISNLPDKAKSFIKKHFKGENVRSCERYYAKGKYEVELGNGVDIEFNTKGEVIEVDAPDRMLLSLEVVKEMLPRKAYDRLVKEGYADRVESIEFNKGKVYEVELSIPDPDTFIFDPSGVFIAIED